MSEMITSFANALQLSLSINIERITDASDKLEIHFSLTAKAKEEKELKLFTRMLKPQTIWIQEHTLQWAYTSNENIRNMTELLLLTRLNKQNLKKIAELDAKFRPWVHKLHLGTAPTPSAKQKVPGAHLSDLLFTQLVKQKSTQNELAKKSGLSLVSLYKFKKGGDIKLSNFLKLLESLNLEMQIKKKKDSGSV